MPLAAFWEGTRPVNEEGGSIPTRGSSGPKVLGYLWKGGREPSRFEACACPAPSLARARPCRTAASLPGPQPGDRGSTPRRDAMGRGPGPAWIPKPSSGVQLVGGPPSFSRLGSSAAEQPTRGLSPLARQSGRREIVTFIRGESPGSIPGPRHRTITTAPASSNGRTAVFAAADRGSIHRDPPCASRRGPGAGTSSSVAEWKGARLLTGRTQVRLLPLEPGSRRQEARHAAGHPWAQRRFDSGRDLHDLHAPFVQRQDGRLSIGRRGFDSRTGYRSSLGVSHW